MSLRRMAQTDVPETDGSDGRPRKRMLPKRMAASVTDVHETDVAEKDVPETDVP